ncbi:MAG: ExbD/TolR family protein [Gemmatimonadales bacterium]|nr:ExbD/TolR family protein [Gemmatimonadales bacterium]
MAGGISGASLGRKRLAVNTEINMTPLVDVALVLLIIFIITAPIMMGGVDVQLPQASTAPLAAKDGVVITVDRAGQVFVDDIPVSAAELQATVRRLMDQRNATGVFVRGDRATPYGNVVRVIAALHEAGITSAGLVTEAEDIRR